MCCVLKLSPDWIFWNAFRTYFLSFNMNWLSFRTKTSLLCSPVPRKKLICWFWCFPTIGNSSLVDCLAIVLVYLCFVAVFSFKSQNVSFMQQRRQRRINLFYQQVDITVLVYNGHLCSSFHTSTDQKWRKPVGNNETFEIHQGLL